MGSNLFTTAASTTWTAPANIAGNLVTVHCWGAGGGGGNNNGTRPGGGGGGGAYARNNVTIVSGNLYPYVVGQGGNYVSNATGNAGANSSFNNNSSGNTAMMVRGAGGAGGSHSVSTTGPGGTTANCIGSTSFKGGEGSRNVTTGTGGGGGGGAGNAAAGTDSVAAQAGGAGGGTGANAGGTGGNGGLTTAAGLNGVAPGGAGGGSGNAGTTKVAGNGQNGQVLVVWVDLTLPVVTTQAVGSITGSTATANGTITDTGDGGTALENDDERGVVYSTTTHADPGNVAPASTAYESSQKETGGSFTAVAFTENLTGLAAATTYFVRAYSHSRKGYAYGGEVSFRTIVTGTIAANLLKPTSAATGIATHTGTISANLLKPTASMSGINQDVGILSSNLPVIQAAMTGSVPSHSTGNFFVFF